MLSDVEFFKARIDKLDGAGDLGDHLIEVVKAKSIIPASQSNSALAAPERDVSSSPHPQKMGEGRSPEEQG
jgi:vacuolar protein sorting-associated protein 54